MDSPGASVDVTELREATKALREAERKLTEEKPYLEQEIDAELGLGEIIGESKALQAMMEQVGKVAASDATVLLLGETGTGKELVARAIHQQSQRANNSFIKMNCAAIPSGLLESELFGNEKGAFTGAVSKKIGRLELADKGTLFLDEIGEISLALQPKLLRVLQDQEFERLGGIHTLKVDFRLIAATNRDLADAVREREFRSDLYYRLNVFPSACHRYGNGGGHPLTSGTFCPEVLSADEPIHHQHSQENHGRAEGVGMAGECARVGEFYRALCDSDARFGAGIAVERTDVHGRNGGGNRG